MLRRKLSAGALRATAQSHAAGSGISPALSSQLVAGASASTKGQSANLASAVLLNSQRRWKEETVVVLKSELKRRGLSQTGNKSALVNRLQSADTSSLLPPVPALPSTLTSKKPISARKVSTTPSVSAAAPTKPEGADQTPVQSETVTSTGPAVISQKTEAAKTETIDADIVDSVPGLPEIGEEAAKGRQTAGEGMSMSMPQFPEEVQPEQVIPLEPDNFRSNRSLPKEEPKTSDTPSGPKVVTVADQTNTPSGGPAHAIHDDLPSVETVEETASDLAQAIPGLGQAIGSALSSPVRALSGLGAVIPPIGAPKGDVKGGEYKANSEPYNAEERKGLYIFGGIVGLGLLLGGGGKKKAVKDMKGKVDGMVGGSEGTVKGDKNWEKASGAGVVGHGTRKA